jgi:hypothetical protein
MPKEEEVQEAEMPLTLDDVDPQDEPEDLLEPESTSEAKSDAPEAPTRPDVERAARLLEAASKPAEPAKPPQELDVFGWQARMVQDYREITDPTSTFFKVAAEKRRELVAQNHPDPDIDYLAAKAAAADPRVTRERNTERARESSRDAASGFPRPSRRPPAPAEPELSDRQMAHAKVAGITNPEVLAGLAADLREKSRELRGR